MDRLPVLLFTLVQVTLISSLEWHLDSDVIKRWNVGDVPDKYTFSGMPGKIDYFKLLYTEKDSMLVGARNAVYNISMVNLQENFERIEWKPTKNGFISCHSHKAKSVEECQNYIQFGARTKSGDLLFCGTNSFKPICRTYKRNDTIGGFRLTAEVTGVGVSPFSPDNNDTFVYADGAIFSATNTDWTQSDPLIYNGKNDGAGLRTRSHDSRWLNDPRFVSSMEIDDKIYYFFRETAVEYINCGKAVFSRVARVCKNDKGGQILMEATWTSFFKARLNCSIPGEFPFYLDEIQSTSDYNQGNYMSTPKSQDRWDMLYAVFTTPENSVRGSAVCAFRMQDIVKVFKGKFKGQKSGQAWLPIEETPHPHPEACANDSKNIPTQTLDFIRLHTLMDSAVPAFGGAPVLMKLGHKSRFTKIAIDWQVHAADGRYYDIIFVGTDDGRVLKSINKGHSKEIESVILEDIVVFEDKQPITDLKIIHNKQIGLDKLIVISRERITTIPLHRCEQALTCSECVALQDPYCSFVGDTCAASDRGLQSISEGKVKACGPPKPETTTKEITPEPTPSIVVNPPNDQQCNCSCGAPGNNNGPNDQSHSIFGETDDRVTNMPNDRITRRPAVRPGVPQQSEESPIVVSGRLEEEKTSILSVAETAIAIVVSIVISSILSFVAGYKVRSCTHTNDDSDDAFLTEKQDIYGSLHKSHQRTMSDSKEPRYVNHAEINNSQKQLNLVVNLTPKGSNLPNGNAPAKPIINLPVSTDNKTYV